MRFYICSPSSSSSSSPSSSSSNPKSSSKPEYLSCTHDVFMASATECYAITSLEAVAGASLKGVEVKGTKGFIIDEYALTEEFLYPAIKNSKTFVLVFTKDFVGYSLYLKIFEKIRLHQRMGNVVLLCVFWSDYDEKEGREQQLRVVNFEDAFKRVVEEGLGDHEQLRKRWTRAADGITVRYSWELSIPIPRGGKKMEHIFYFIKNKVDGTDLVLPRRRIGIQIRRNEILNLLGSLGNDVKIVAIWGIGGIGKTTVARAFYNHIRHFFLRGSFIGNIQNAWRQSDGQLQLLKQLLSDVSNEKIDEINDIEMGIARLKMALKDKKALIILDDVSQIDQLNALCGSREWFGSGSVIVITTRNKDLLNDFRFNYEYEMRKLDEEESLLLFSAQVSPSSTTGDFMVLSRDIAINYCEGLPLVLKVLGSLLCNRTMPEWESVLQKLKGILSGKIKEKLKISIDSLAYSEKDLFINIACFYVGKSKHYVTQILNCSELIDVLIQRSLVRIDMNDKLDVHDLLQEIIAIPNDQPQPEYLYDVFLSFRGEDTRESFTSHLCNALEEDGIVVFMDQGLEKGENILFSLLEAIDASRISIIVFSENYAGSQWCMKELEKIMDCHESIGQVVFPIFYHVQPTDVRNQINTFGKSLSLSISANGDKEEKWKKTLTEAANLSGWDLQKFRTETELIKSVLEKVDMKLEANTKCLVPRHPVGLKSRMLGIIQLLGSKSDEVIIAGIWGMGGVGKTTIAKAIYNELRRNFGNKSFLENIRELWEQDINGPVNLQKQLLSDIFKMKRVRLQNIEWGKAIMKDKLRGKRALVVLDDVNNVDQLDALYGSHEWFGKGSRIIITTRDEKLLKKLEAVVRVFNVKEMDENESLELFSWHAFKKPMPKNNFLQLSKTIVSNSGRLPLSLEILGSYFSNKNTIHAWGSVLDKLHEVQNHQVYGKLRLCYDALDDHKVKEIFLIICCFFIGKDKNYVTQILNSCELEADDGITRLIELCLVKVDKNNKLGMHDLLCDMGREIIREKSPGPEKLAQLWLPNDVLDVLTNNTDISTTKGLALNFSIHDTQELGTEAFQNMNKLELLQLHHVKLVGDYKYLSKELRWLNWQGFPYENLPADFSQESIVAMELKNNNLKQVWIESKQLERLKFLNLSHSHDLTQSPDFSKLPNLVKLKLKDCPSLSMIDPTIGDLKHLVLLNLKDCINLSNLPGRIYNLTSLDTFILSGCSKIDRLDEDIKQMKSLTTLRANQTAITQVPYSLITLKNLKYVALCGYEGLASDIFPSLTWSRGSSSSDPQPGFPLSNNNEIIMETRPSTSQGSYEEIIPTSTSVHVPEIIHMAGSENSPSSLIIQLGRPNEEVIKTLLDNISQGRRRGFDSPTLPGDCYHFQSEGFSVLFEVPQVAGRSLKGLILCISYLSTQDSMTLEYPAFPISVLIANRTKHTTDFYKQDATNDSNDKEWHIISALDPGNKVQFIVTFACDFTVEKTLIYLLYD